ncbi:MAG: hypothetical protein H5U19_10870 [Rhodobacteraceae bacterium]|nr:hypothetical protein [Paracoccaceae bacterium]
MRAGSTGAAVDYPTIPAFAAWTGAADLRPPETRPAILGATGAFGTPLAGVASDQTPA